VNRHAKSARQPIASVTDPAPEAKRGPAPAGQKGDDQRDRPAPKAKSDPPPRTSP
jgi:hypothetical protein